MTFLVIRAIKKKKKTKVERGRSRLPALPSASPRDELLRFHEKNKKTSPAGESPARACAGRAADPLAIRRAPTPGPARVPPAPGRAGAFPALKHFLLAFIILGAAAVLPGGERGRVGRVSRRPLSITAQPQGCEKSGKIRTMKPPRQQRSSRRWKNQPPQHWFWCK